jgi:hypothetical protein
MVKVRAVSVAPATFALLEALQVGTPLMAACEAALGQDDTFDLNAGLATAFSEGLITDCLTGE